MFDSVILRSRYRVPLGVIVQIKQPNVDATDMATCTCRIARHRLAGLCCAVGVLFAASSCSDDSSSEPTLRDGLALQLKNGAGITLSDDEAECADRTISEALNIEFPATWAAYTDAMQDRMTGVQSEFEATGELNPDTVLAEATAQCWTASTMDQFTVFEYTQLRWSDLTAQQQTCLADLTRPFQTAPPPAVSVSKLQEACDAVVEN